MPSAAWLTVAPRRRTRIGPRIDRRFSRATATHSSAWTGRTTSRDRPRPCGARSLARVSCRLNLPRCEFQEVLEVVDGSLPYTRLPFAQSVQHPFCGLGGEVVVVS